MMEAEPAKVVGQFSSGIVGWIEAQQLRQQDAHFRIRKPPKLKTEDDRHGEQSLDAFVAEPQGRRSLTVDLGKSHDPIGSGTTPILRERLPLRQSKLLAGTARSSPLSTGAIFRIMRHPYSRRKYTSSV